MKKSIFNIKRAYILIALFSIVVFAAGTVTIAFLSSGTNSARNAFAALFPDKDPDGGTDTGETGPRLMLEKRVDGQIYATWSADYDGEVAELLSGMSFELYRVSEKGAPILAENRIDTTTLDSSDGKIKFDTTEEHSGWFAVKEVLTGVAADVFQDVPPLYLYLFEGVMTKTEFDPGSHYWASDLWVAKGRNVAVNTKMTNGVVWGDTKYIKTPDGTEVTAGNVIQKWEVRTNTCEQCKYASMPHPYKDERIAVTSCDNCNFKSYPAFCAYYGSASLGEGDYYVRPYDSDLDPVVEARILSAFNYIDWRWGSVDGWLEDAWCPWASASEFQVVEKSTRVLSQVAVWMLLDDKVSQIEVKNGEGSGHWYTFINEYIDDVLKAAKDGFVNPDGNRIVDIAYLKVPSATGGYKSEIHAQPQIVPMYRSDVTFDNTTKATGLPGEKPTADDPDSFLLEKRVNGEALGTWLYEHVNQDDIEKILAGLRFELYKVEGKGIAPTGSPIANAEEIQLDDKAGAIVFKGVDLEPGWYAVVESFTNEEAARVFQELGPQYFFVGNGGKALGGENFDMTADYFVSWDWVKLGEQDQFGALPGVLLRTEFDNGVVWGDGANDRKSNRFGTSDELNNQYNEAQKITARTSMGSEYKEYNAFCAHVGSWSYSGSAYVPEVLDKEAYANILSAFNYIFDTYGSLDGWCEGVDYDPAKPVVTAEDATKVLGQMAVWYYIPTDEGGLNKIVDIRAKDEARYGAINEAWLGVLQAVEAGYKGKGKVVDLVYLKGSGAYDHIGNAQPQIIPMYEDNAFFNNQPKEASVHDGLFPVNFKIGGAPGNVTFVFDLYKMDSAGQYSFYSGPWATDEEEAVHATGLTPGKYVFIERPEDCSQEQAMALTWTSQPEDADGLYFTLGDYGKITPWDN